MLYRFRVRVQSIDLSSRRRQPGRLAMTKLFTGDPNRLATTALIPTTASF
ncbi:MAG: hypothetical protein KGQ47_05500 [Hyphomicrobiales bacterium]|nr:hypothetical protein [Hyphomicrobiales bacterium]MDE1973906.1 hypothetical protein [Hyphomicrobiales bacterium]